ncbi:hypothetical protein [Dehalobacterium formicoaceticum]|uniref:Card1 CARF domain-containing protein n=1 Tax=Dehalobacterium formicoaceticum TaxID=51515 RepID=A0ABT1Y7L4_9FIRM|nr:hypothetical protein [Dehalobacterium formicoaceticum]MCR6546875.1 hypothetical protein [Dehalobacterium formicoaceticum]
MFEEKFSDLVLLVGTNPLPNYVVSKYFQNQNKKLRRIWLVHSEEERNINQRGTKHLAENIRQAILGEWDEAISINYVSLSNIASAERIERDIKEYLSPAVLTSTTGLHLNYTGGTKAMAVHVYRSLEELWDRKCSFSYLNARNFCIHVDQEGVITEDLRDEVKLSLEGLTKLHGCEKSKEDKNKREWPEADAALEDMVNKGEISNYLDWVENTLKYIYFDTGKKPNNLREHMINFQKLERWEEVNNDVVNAPEYIKNILRGIPREYSPINDDGSVWIPSADVTKIEVKRRADDPIDGYLAGKWLEKYVANVIKRNIEQEDLNWPTEMNWYIKNHESHDKKFELDVIFMNGYQVCCISCTTARAEGICKGKGFEVLLRVEQIGGEEGKPVLVTCLEQSKVQKVESDLEKIRGSGDRKLLVLGREDLQEDVLWSKIIEHVKGGD